MNKFHLKLIIGLLLFSNFQISAQGFLRTEGKDIVDENGDVFILRGMGLGGWMLQEGYMLQTADFANAEWQIREKIEELIGEADTDEFYEAWLANHCRKADIDALKSWGFNSIRLPMHYKLFTLPIEEEPVAGQNTWLDKGFELTDSVISWCAQNEMYVILDLHGAPGGQGYDQGISDYNPAFPSLWESQANRDKMVALWKQLAERYVDEPWVGGYDLLNEPNWDLPGNTQLRALYNQLIAQIRQIDQNHIIFIEGNWFANDFTGLTPPWDDNMVYAPHKYWSTNDQGSIQWVLNIRDQYNVPLYLGESGENSNVWFRDAIKLLEDNGIGWAWWPMKKIEAIAGPLSIKKTTGYQTLLNYWSGNGTQPTPAFAKAALMQMTDNLKIENCVFQKDVIDAMFRQVQSDETIPYSTHDIPGVVYASDYDLGILGEAYHDADVATYHVSTGNFTAWNAGWAYRNDGVDIEKSNDFTNSNGYMVGFTADDEWLQYEVNIAETAVYDVEIRVASGGTGGQFHFSVDGSDITETRYVPNTGGWQSWETITQYDVILSPNDKKMRFHIDHEGFNFGSFKFIEKAATSTLDTKFVSAHTIGNTQVQMNVNKPLADPIPASPTNFEIVVNGSSVPIIDAVLSGENSRIITFTVDHVFKSSEVIKISYSGDQITAEDGTILKTFNLEDVQNNAFYYHPISGKIEAEDFIEMSGIQLEATTDVGGGENIGYLDVGDYVDYLVDVEKTGIYNVDYRTASDGNTGGIDVKVVEDDGSLTQLHSAFFAPTGGWQNWATTSKQIYLFKGQQRLRLIITQPQFNLNWLDFSSTTSTQEIDQIANFMIFPNPNSGHFFMNGTLKESQDVLIEVRNLLGQVVLTKNLTQVSEIQESIELEHAPNGKYFVSIRMDNGAVYSEKIVKLGE
jgi:aryl-phospho-beta-D-glucosidase BglC (GH1 family)